MTIGELIDAATLKLAAVGAVIGAGVSAARHVIEQKYGSWGVWLRGMVAGVLAGIITSLLLDGIDLPHAVELGITCIAVYVADDALQGIRVIGRMFGAEPIAALRRVIDGLRGGSGGGTPPTNG